MKTQTFIYSVLIIILGLFSACKNSAQPTDLPIQLSASDTKASCVFLTADEKGIPAVSWVETDSSEHSRFFFAKWNQKQNTFGENTEIPMEDNAAIHEEGMPKIVFKGDGSLVAIYETYSPMEGSRFGRGDVRFVLSTDQGLSWTSPKSVFGESDKLSFSFSSFTRLEDGEIAAACLGTNFDAPNGGRPVLFAKTVKDQGFSEPIIVENEACQCCRTAISGGSNGHISIVYRDLIPGDIRDITLITSFDNGESFSKPDPFSDDFWEVSGCPHNGPSVKVKGDKTYVAWFSGGIMSGVYYAEIDAEGKMTDKRNINSYGKFIQLDILGNGTPVTAYDCLYTVGDSAYRKIIVNKIEDELFYEKEITQPQVKASHPVVQTLNDNDFIVAWKDDNQIFYRAVKSEEIQNEARESTKINQAVELPLAKLISGIDPVCGMHLTGKSLGDTTLYKNDIVGFCSEHCKHKFVQHPEEYPISREDFRFNL